MKKIVTRLFRWARRLFRKQVPRTRSRSLYARLAEQADADSLEGDVHGWSAGIWKISDLVDQAQSALAVMEDPSNALKTDVFGPSNADLALPKKIGPFVVDHHALLRNIPFDEEMGRFRIDPRFGLPKFAFVGLDRRDVTAELKDDGPLWIFGLMVRNEKLPVGWAQTGPGYVYAISAIMQYPKKAKRKNQHQFRLSYFFTIDANGWMYPARQRVQRNVRIGRGRSYSRSEWQVWKGWVRPIEKGSLSFGALCAIMLSVAPAHDAHWCLRVESRIRDGAKSRLLHRAKFAVNFVINPLLVTRLFKDRDKVESVLTPSGRRKPIMHWVKAHHRHLIHKISNVKTHIRGTRQFLMNGSRCELWMPGKHLGNLMELDITTYYRDTMLGEDGKFQPLPGTEEERDEDDNLDHLLAGPEEARGWKPKYYPPPVADFLKKSA